MPKHSLCIKPDIICSPSLMLAPGIVHVEGLQEHAKNGEAINRLVLDNSNKKLIQAACEVDDIPWRVDEVDNKGEGQIIMLHGLLEGSSHSCKVADFGHRCTRNGENLYCRCVEYSWCLKKTAIVPFLTQLRVLRRSLWSSTYLLDSSRYWPEGGPD